MAVQTITAGSMGAEEGYAAPLGLCGVLKINKCTFCNRK